MFLKDTSRYANKGIVHYTTENGGEITLRIIDEWCECGQLKSEHGGVIHSGGAGDCERFTFNGFIYEDHRKKSKRSRR
jgi:hypothetical protein